MNTGGTDPGSLPNTSREARLEQFIAGVDPWELVLAIVWLPVLIVPLITTLHGALADAFEKFYCFVWAAFAVEYAVKLRLAVDRRHFVRHYLLDLAIVAVPNLQPLRLARLFRFIRLARVTSS